MNSAVNKRTKNRSTIPLHSNVPNINSKSQTRQKTPNERTITPEGVYFNGRVMHVTTSLIGCVVQVEVKDGTKYEGVLKTFSPDFELVVDYVAKVEPNLTPNSNSGIGSNISNLLTSLQAKNPVSPTIIFKFSDVVKLTAINVDLDFASTKGQMLTDTEISRYDGRQIYRDKELVPWEGESTDGDGLEELDDHSVSENGWDAEDMFKTNEIKFKVRSTYEPTLKDYTVPLVKGEGEDYEQRQAQAEKIANEIEGDAARIERYAKEDADEEERYSAVVRPNDNVQHARQQPQHQNRRKPNTQSNFNVNCGGTSSARGRGSQSANASASSPFHSSKPQNSSASYNKQQYSSGSSVTSPTSSSAPSYQAHSKPTQQSNQHQNYREDSSDTKGQYGGAVTAYGNQMYSKPETDETTPSGHSSHVHHSGAPPNQHPLPQRNLNENRRGVGANKRKEDVAADLKKFSVDFKLPSNVDSNKEIVKSETHAKATNNSKGGKHSSDCPPVKDKLDLGNDKELSENKPIEPPVSPLSTGLSSESEIAKKSTLNPNAKTFTPRSPLAPVNTSSTPPSVASTPSSTVSSVHMAPPMTHHHQHHQQQPQHQQHPQQPRFQNPLVQLQTQYNVLPPGLSLPLGPNQYLMTNVAMAPTFAQQNVNQQSRSFRNKGPQQFTNHNVRHDFGQPSHVAAQVTGHPVLATAPIAAPQQLPVGYSTQQNPGMVTPPGPPQAMYSHVYQQFHPRMNMLPPQAAAMGMMQHAVQYADPNLQHIYATAGTVQLQHLVSQAHQHMTNSGPHSGPSTPQSGTPTTPLHGAPAPSPVHHQPNQPPTPTPQQAVMYANVASPHAQQSGGHSNSGYHHAQPQLVIIPSGQVGGHHGSGHGQLHAHALSHNATPGNHHGGPPPALMPVQLIPSNAAQGLTTFNPNPGV